MWNREKIPVIHCNSDMAEGKWDIMQEALRQKRQY